MRQALEDGILSADVTLFDFGCGRGSDIAILKESGIEADGWDPAHAPTNERHQAEVVNLGYVVNVIEDPDERADTLREAWSLATSTLIVSGRLSHESKRLSGVPIADGIRTSRNTFQKVYEQDELRAWIEATIDAPCTAAAPGVFYVFRDPARAHELNADRFRRRVAIPRLERTAAVFEANRALLELFMGQVAELGRLPAEDEWDGAAEIRAAFSTPARALAVVRTVTGEGGWEAIGRARAQDVLVTLALSRFGRRPKFSELPRRLQLDVRAFFSNYADACARADRLLFGLGNQEAVDLACRASLVGKLTPNALYVHVSARELLPAALRVYEGCARVVTGNVADANIIKLGRREPKISYLSYPRFDADPHPELAASVVVRLGEQRMHWRDYSNSANPPVLHRKETFIGTEHPRHALYSRLTAAEERAGLLEETDDIGTRDGWLRRLASEGYELRGHRLARSTRTAL